ncbi:MAG: hypothetical protein IIX04_00945 [Alistipes sp.]|nr:hypothetical protein [Alistipes sp.]MBR0393657.1 hypothetical protein [Alistipes sp.]
MKKIFSIVIAFALFAVSCEQTNAGSEQAPVKPATALVYSLETIAEHNVVVVKPEDATDTVPVVVVLAEDIELKTRSQESLDVNFKAAEHCLIGGYALCVVETSAKEELSFLSAVKETFPTASKFYLLSYRNGLAYTAAMQMPDEFAAFGCVSGAIDVDTYKTNSFVKAVPFVHVHAKKNPVCKWEGVKDKSVSVPLSVGAIVAINECITFETTELLPREGKGRVECTLYTNALSGCQVKLYSVDSANEGWCDEEFEVYNQIWNFFKIH